MKKFDVTYSKERPAPYEFRLKPLQKQLESLPEEFIEDFEFSADNFDFKKDLDALKDIVWNVYKTVFEANQNKPDEDSQFLQNLLADIAIGLESIKFFQEEIDTQKDRTLNTELTNSQIEWKKAAVNQLKEKLEKDIEKIKKIPTEKISPKARYAFDRIVNATLLVISLISVLENTFEQQEPQISVERVSETGKQKSDKKLKEKKAGKGGGLRKNQWGSGTPGEPHEPGISDVEKEKTPYFGSKIEVDIPLFSDIDDNFWESGMLAWSWAGDKPELRFIKTEPVKRRNNKIQARVRVSDLNNQSSKNVPAFVPVGFQSEEISTNQDGEATYDQSRRVIDFNDQTNVINYEVYSGSEKLTLPENNPTERHFFPGEKELIKRLSKAESEDEIIELISARLSKFIYITSSELDMLFKQIEGDFAEKVASMEFGDCDFLSAYVVDLLNRAGLDAVVSVGVIEEDGELKAEQRHAKVVLIYKGKKIPIETTDKTRKSFKKVDFSDEDLQILQKEVDKINNSDQTDPRRKSLKYYHFTWELSKILEKDEYKEFNQDEELSGLMKQLSDAWKDLEKMEKTGKIPTKESLAYFLGFLLVFLGLMMTPKAFEKVAESMRKEQEKQLADMITPELIIAPELIEAADSEETDELKNKMNNLVTEMYQNRIEREVLQRIIPYEDALGLSPEKQRILLLSASLSLTFASPYSHDIFDSLSTIFSRIEWNRMVKNLEKKGMNEQTLLEYLSSFKLNKKHVKLIKEMIPKQVKSITEEGKRFAIEIEKKTQHIKGKRKTKALLTELGIQQVGSEVLGKGVSDQKNIEYAESRKYQLGDDTSRIDWALYARTRKLFVKTSPPEILTKQPERVFDLVIDVTNVGARENAQLSALLLLAQKNAIDVGFSSISFFANGKVVGKIEKNAFRQFKSQRAVESIIKRILTLRLEHSFLIEGFEMRKTPSTIGYRNTIQALASRMNLTSSKKSVLGVGIPNLPPEERLLSYFSFEVPQQAEV